MGTNNKKKTATAVNGEGRKRNKAIIFPPELLLEEMVWEILIRLPVKSLTRFKLVSKACHAIISAPLLVRAHLHCSKHTQCRVPSSFLIAPRVFLQSDVPYTPISTDIRFYHWSLPLQQQLQRPSCRRRTRSTASRESATLLYQRHFPPGEFTLGAPMAHCDSLVLLPSDTNVYVFNPAIKDRRNVIQYPTCLPVGLGLDPSTGKYKVARSFYRHCDDYGHVTMGMEVFTISSGRDQDDGWKETSEDPPALIAYQQTTVQCKGYLFYFIDKVNHPCLPQALLHFSLQHETFGFTPLLDTVYPQVKDKDIILHELDGELCATFFSECLQRVLVWMTRDFMDPRRSFLYYKINVSSHCLPMAYTTRVLLAYDHLSCRYYLKAHGAFKEDVIFDMDDLKFLGPNGEDTLGHAWQKKKWWFDLVSYTERLVPVTPPKQRENL
ncbi:hypothetical protein VPH35_067902 [Triticum aestivum]